MEYLFQNIDWLKDELDSFDEDEYIILDCPGQVELYSHLPIMHNLSQQLVNWGFRVVSVYLLDALFVSINQFGLDVLGKLVEIKSSI
jgi:GTPase SAR1 family protein